MNITEARRSLQPELDREGLLHRITSRIRQSLDLTEILKATVAEVRSLLETDRVMVYRFHADASGEVIAESIHDNRLPSMQGLNFPADDIPPHAREMFLKERGRSIVDIEQGLIGVSLPNNSHQKELQNSEEIDYRPINPCHVEYLTAMGVRSSLVVPILQYDTSRQQTEAQLWGLLVSHHSEAHTVAKRELQIVQLVADQVSIAIAQSTLLRQAQERAQREATVNRTANLLHALPEIELQEALNETVAAFLGAGGRIYIAPNESRGGISLPAQIFTCGDEPKLIELNKNRPLEEHPIWQGYFNLKEDGSNNIQAIADLYKEPQLRVIAPAFRSTQIRGMLVIPLQYRQQFQGYISIFRHEVDTKTLWAGRFDPDGRQLQARNSFEIWQEIKKGQACEWTKEEIELAQALGHHFSMAIQQYILYQQVYGLNANLECQVQEQTAELQRSLDSAKVLKQVTDQIRSTLDLDTILQTIVREVRNLLNTERVVIYQFTRGWRGEVVVEAVSGEWLSLVGKTYEDKCFTEDHTERYQQEQVRAINNVAQSDLSPCHIEFLQKIQVQANLVVPIGKSEQLWGLLIAHACRDPRVWQAFEIELLQQLALQAAVAIQQAELYKQSCTAEAEAIQKAEQLEQSAEQQKAAFRVITKIRESLNINTILNATVTEVRHMLESDRVGVFRFHHQEANGSDRNYDCGEFISEDVRPGFKAATSIKVQDHCFSDRYATKYIQGRIQVVADIYDAGLSECHIEILKQFQVRAILVVPLLKGDILWGLLCIHQCDAPRQWNDGEIDFVTQIAAQLSVALQQAELLAQTQHQTEQLSSTLQALKKTQTQLIQTEKMSGLGQLVAGIAHEINNPVNFIYGNLTYAAQYAQDLFDLLEVYQQCYPHPKPEVVEQAKVIDLEFVAEDLPKILMSMKVGAERIRQLVLSLRNFSRLDQAERKPVNIHEGIDNTLLILQHRLKPKQYDVGIKIVKDYGDLPQVECYAGQLNQVFMNVISNALDALEQRDSERALEELESNPSQITIRTELKSEVKSMKDKNVCTSSVVIKIADNGLGMNEIVRSQIFDPFFTTKPVGKGTGLGLSISYQIVVERHGGSFKCVSLPGQGTEFWIEIPIQE